MVGRSDRKQQNDNFLSGMFGNANGGQNFFAQLMAMFSAFFNGNGGNFFANLFGNNNAAPSSAPAAESRSLYQRGRDTVVNGFNQVGRLLGEGMDAVKNLIARGESAGNYHRVYAGREVMHMPLSDMTVNEVLAWQRQHTQKEKHRPRE